MQAHSVAEIVHGQESVLRLLLLQGESQVMSYAAYRCSPYGESLLHPYSCSPYGESLLRLQANTCSVTAAGSNSRASAGQVRRQV